MITIGVTGGVGSGKSEILRYLENRYNCRVLLADDAAKDLEVPGGAVYEPLVELLTGWERPENLPPDSISSGDRHENGGSPAAGRQSELDEMNTRRAPHEALLLENGEINKVEMARRIFADAALLLKVNELVHPAVNRYIIDEIERERKSGEREFFVLEAALLVEYGYDRIVDTMWYIYCDKEVRRERLKASRGYSDEKIDRIMGNQVSEEEYRRHCDVVIDNTGPLTAENGALSQVDAAVAALRERFYEI